MFIKEPKNTAEYTGIIPKNSKTGVSKKQRKSFLPIN